MKVCRDVTSVPPHLPQIQKKLKREQWQTLKFRYNFTHFNLQ
jgi:hypothetical protein